MSEHLDVHLGQADGALVRLLGLVERRGYPTLAVSAAPLGAQTLLVRLTVAADRPLDHLVHQLRKLYDVKHVETTR